MYLFLFNENGEFAGWQEVAQQRDVDAMTKQRELFVVIPDTETKKLDDKYYVPNVSEGRLKWRIELRPRFVGKANKTTVEADGVDEVVIQGLPIPCRMRVDGVPVEVNDGSFEVTFDVRGAYKIELDQWPYRPWSVVIRAK